MSKTIHINGVDFSSFFTRVGYSVGYTSVQGNQGGLMQDGSFTEDELAIKASIVLPCLPLNEAQMAQLLEAVYAYPYITLYYYDPRSAGYRTIMARRSKVEQKYRGTGTDGKDYWTGSVLTLQEK